MALKKDFFHTHEYYLVYTKKKRKDEFEEVKGKGTCRKKRKNKWNAGKKHCPTMQGWKGLNYKTLHGFQSMPYSNCTLLYHESTNALNLESELQTLFLTSKTQTVASPSGRY